MLKQRLFTAMIGLPLLLGLLTIGTANLVAYFFSILAAIAFLETKQLLNLIMYKDHNSKLLNLKYKFINNLLMSLFLILVFKTLTSSWITLFEVLLALFCLFSLWTFFTAQDVEECVKNWVILIFSFSYGFMPSLALWYLYSATNDGRFLFYLFNVIIASDTAAYFIGRRFGKHPLASKFSPKKSQEGAVAGIIAGVLAGLTINYFYEQNFGSWLFVFILSSVLALVGIIGDLLESGLKRSAGVKDSGNFLPGHGGILDRLDSFYITAPLALLVFRVCKYF